MSTFGSVFRVTTFGESHGAATGVVIDGVPPLMQLSEADVQAQLNRRRPGQSSLTTPRDEADVAEILSGTENGITLGTPVAIMVRNMNTRPSDYGWGEVPRPGHADYTYTYKYGIHARSGGGRSSARETIGRVAAGAVAEKWMDENYRVAIVCFVSQIGEITIPAGVTKSLLASVTREQVETLGTLRLVFLQKHCKAIEADRDSRKVAESAFVQGESCSDAVPAYMDHEGNWWTRHGEAVDPQKYPEYAASAELVHVRCPHPQTAARMATLIRCLKWEGDSVGGIVTCVCRNVPPGVGEPCFDKLEAKLAQAMLSLPATKAFEIGEGFKCATMRGSEHNDMFIRNEEPSSSSTYSRYVGGPSNAASGSASSTIACPTLGFASNHAGGTLGGIATGAPIVFRVAVKPPSSIGREQRTATFSGEVTTLVAKGRHDPCVLPRVPPIVEAMASCTLMDAILQQRTRSIVQAQLPLTDRTPSLSQPAAQVATPQTVQKRLTKQCCAQSKTQCTLPLIGVAGCGLCLGIVLGIILQRKFT